MPAAPAVHLYSLLQQRQVQGRTLRFPVTADWQQGRTVFGGLMAALAVQAMRDIAGPQWPTDVALRALQTNFIGPMTEGVGEIEVHTLREGKNVRQVQATLRQNGETAAVFIGVFAGPRDSTLPELNPAMPAIDVQPDDVPALPYLPGLTPAFTQHIDFRLAQGALPFTGGSGWDTKIYMRLHAGEIDPQTAHLDEVLAVIFADGSKGCLMMNTLSFTADCREPDAAVLAPQQAEVQQEQIDMARQLIDAMPDGNEVLAAETDEAIALKRELVEEALAGKAIEAPAPKAVAETKAEADLTALLAASKKAAPKKKAKAAA